MNTSIARAEIESGRKALMLNRYRAEIDVASDDSATARAGYINLQSDWTPGRAEGARLLHFFTFCRVQSMASSHSNLTIDRQRKGRSQMPTKVSRRLPLALFAGVTLGAFALPAWAGAGHNASFGTPAKPSQATRTVTVTMQDNLFEPETLAVKPGEIVRFVIVNKGALLHEFNIGTAASHAAHQKEMATMLEHGMLTPTGINREMMKMDHSHMHGMAPTKHDDANSVLVEPGKTGELVWKFAEAADLEFACNVPGHYESGMAGKISMGK